jgi:hypothetical protein
MSSHTIDAFAKVALALRAAKTPLSESLPTLQRRLNCGAIRGRSYVRVAPVFLFLIGLVTEHGEQLASAAVARNMTHSRNGLPVASAAVLHRRSLSRLDEPAAARSETATKSASLRPVPIRTSITTRCPSHRSLPTSWAQEKCSEALSPRGPTPFYQLAFQPPRSTPPANINARNHGRESGVD